MPKKIAFVIGALTSGGAERVISTLSNALTNDYEVVIIAFRKGKPFYPLNTKVKVIFCLDEIPPSKSIFDSIRLNTKLLSRLIKLLKLEKIEVALGFITMANVLTIIASKFCGIPCIISERNNPYTDASPRFWKFLRRITYPLANTLVVQTQKIKGFYEKKIRPEKIVILPNPISKELSKKRDPNLPKKNFILNVGRLHEQKNQKLLINAFSNLNSEDWQLVIIGDGPEKKHLNRLIQNSRNPKSIILAGKKQNIEEYYNRAKIFAFTSNYEGFPNALIEAMHFGIPCISTDCPTGPSELIDDKNGFLIPVENQKALEEKMQILINNSALRNLFSKRSPAATKRFEEQNVIVKWKEIIDRF